MEVEDKPRFLESLRLPVSGLSVVQVESTTQARELVQEAERMLQERPIATISLIAKMGREHMLLDDARTVTREWDSGQGVLFLCDESDGEASPDFWRSMNLLREHWGAINAQIVFLLLPGNYRLISLVADHLLAWAPLKFDLRRIGYETYQPPIEHASGILHSSDPRSARWMLKTLQEDLNGYLKMGGDDRAFLVNRYYVPMFRSATIADDFVRAQGIAREIDEDLIAESGLRDWLVSNMYLSRKMGQLNEAKKIAERLRQVAERSGESNAIAESLFLLGLVSEESGELVASRDFYEKSRELNDSLGNELGAGVATLHLGTLAQRSGELEVAETWFRKSLDIFDRHRDYLNIAISCQNLGILAHERRDFETAENWLLKSLEIYERLGEVTGTFSAYFALGMIAIARSQLEKAETWIQRGLETLNSKGESVRVADASFVLGELAELRHDYEEAEVWFRRSLGVQERLGQDSNVAPRALIKGRVAMLHGQFAEAGRSIIHFLNEESVGKNEGLRGAVLPLLPRIYALSSEGDRSELRKTWSDAHLDRFGIVWEFPEKSQTR